MSFSRTTAQNGITIFAAIAILSGGFMLPKAFGGDDFRGISSVINSVVFPEHYKPWKKTMAETSGMWEKHDRGLLEDLAAAGEHEDHLKAAQYCEQLGSKYPQSLFALDLYEKAARHYHCMADDKNAARTLRKGIEMTAAWIENCTDSELLPFAFSEKIKMHVSLTRFAPKGVTEDDMAELLRLEEKRKGSSPLLCAEGYDFVTLGLQSGHGALHGSAAALETLSERIRSLESLAKEEKDPKVKEAFGASLAKMRKSQNQLSGVNKARTTQPKSSGCGSGGCGSKATDETSGQTGGGCGSKAAGSSCGSAIKSATATVGKSAGGCSGCGGAAKSATATLAKPAGGCSGCGSAVKSATASQ